jgi:hypothetical protein
MEEEKVVYYCKTSYPINGCSSDKHICCQSCDLPSCKERCKEDDCESKLTFSAFRNYVEGDVL